MRRHANSGGKDRGKVTSRARVTRYRRRAMGATIKRFSKRVTQGRGNWPSGRRMNDGACRRRERGRHLIKGHITRRQQGCRAKAHRISGRSQGFTIRVHVRRFLLARVVTSSCRGGRSGRLYGSYVRYFFLPWGGSYGSASFSLLFRIRRWSTFHAFTPRFGHVRRAPNCFFQRMTLFV